MQLTPDLEALLRMGLAVLCGLAVGFNRARHTQAPHPNRVRVHVLVGLSACLMVLAAAGLDGDPQASSRAIQGVATGVGFLGAGEILVDRGTRKRGTPQVHGLTSAASIWFTASLGVTVAASTPVLALAALGLALITLSSSENGHGEGPIAAPKVAAHADAAPSDHRAHHHGIHGAGADGGAGRERRAAGDRRAGERRRGADRPDG
ncbi:MgtC/SapB family protein [Vulcanococcus limneticus]|uniref:MgtC/SapB family protein n=1 Tax=Vulcanococcus limneticus TaxID=2170428 RepID=UPI00398BCCEB